ncbi:hypothetical protein [uncultured Dysosmobacter sp.]|uniref:hypothetical protein n=1 Tax=uncultured Dysosmobacter sp. TaxID=2591384 RepID=UPI0026343547|nr:hypothetical protein [uncultured Dysosmobacter sp.]
MINLLLKMLERLTGGYTKDPNSMIGRLFRIFAESLWGIEDTLQVIAVWRDVDNAKGYTLDRMGRNFGVARDGATDRFYRLMIKVKITALLSGGDVDTVITAASVLFNIDPAKVEVVELFPAKCRVIMDEADIDPEYVAYAGNTAPIVKRIMAAGVGREVYFRTPKKVTGTLYAGAGRLEDITVTVQPYTNSFTASGGVFFAGVLFENITINIKTKED